MSAPLRALRGLMVGLSSVPWGEQILMHVIAGWLPGSQSTHFESGGVDAPAPGSSFRKYWFVSWNCFTEVMHKSDYRTRTGQVTIDGTSGVGDS